MNSQEYVNRLFNLEGHVGIVTGASRGIGMGIAKVLTDAGAKVYNFSRRNRSDEECISGHMIDAEIDITQHEETAKWIERIEKEEGHLDFLVNNAGMTYKAKAQEFPEEQYHKLHSLNMEAAFELSRQAYPYLSKSSYTGRIVNIASMAVKMGFTGVVPYCMTKSGIEGMTIGLAEEWKKDHILVNSVTPGWVLTKLNEEMFEKNPERKAAALQRITLERFGSPLEVGHMVLFLLSEASIYLTGQNFCVDGGASTHGF